MSVENTLKERGARYGSFEEHATIAQAIQSAYKVYPDKWNKLPPILKQGLTTIADKIARMLNGDHMYEDNIHDIIGYAKLMETWVIRANSQKAFQTPAPLDTGITSAPVATTPHIRFDQVTMPVGSAGTLFNNS